MGAGLLTLAPSTSWPHGLLALFRAGSVRSAARTSFIWHGAFAGHILLNWSSWADMIHPDSTITITNSKLIGLQMVSMCTALPFLFASKVNLKLA